MLRSSEASCSLDIRENVASTRALICAPCGILRFAQNDKITTPSFRENE